jgi:hypothetical protein
MSAQKEEVKQAENIIVEENTKQENILGTEKIGKLLKKFSIPCIISLLVSSLYNIVDQIFIRTRSRVFRKCSNQYCISTNCYCNSICTINRRWSCSKFKLMFRKKR